MGQRPNFKDDREEAEFWSTHDSTEFLEGTESVGVTFVDARPPKKRLSPGPEPNAIESADVPGAVMRIPAAEARRDLSRLLRQVKEGPIAITRRGKPVGVLITPEEYRELRRAWAYLKTLRLSQDLAEGIRGVPCLAG